MTDGHDGAPTPDRAPPDFARRERLESLGATLASVAHELNNPLTAIAGFAQLLLEHERDPGDRIALETIRREAERSSRIVRELLALSRGEPGEEPAPVDVNDVVRYVARTRRYAQSTHGVECTLSLDDPAPITNGGRRQLEQVVLNLLTNAERAAGARADSARSEATNGATPHIAVTTRRDGPAIHLFVDDSGPGLTPEALDHAWDPFWTEGREDGTGLGLHVVRRIVEKHGGSVAAELSPFGGARFHVTLPALDGVAAPAVARRALDILVIHDDVTHTEFLTRFLSARGHAVVTSQVDRVAPVLVRMPFDVVICELAALRYSDALEHVNSVGDRSRLVVTAPQSPAGAELPVGAIFVREPFDVELLRRAAEDGH